MQKRQNYAKQARFTYWINGLTRFSALSQSLNQYYVKLWTQFGYAGQETQKLRFMCDQMSKTS